MDHRRKWNTSDNGDYAIVNDDDENENEGSDAKKPKRELLKARDYKVKFIYTNRQCIKINEFLK